MQVQRISGNVGNLGGNAKKMGNQGVDAGYQGGNSSIVVEITWSNNGNEKLKIEEKSQ